jgi:Rrf2 family protein
VLHCSRKTRLALEAVLDIAYNARPDPVQSRDVTARLGIPQRYLEQVMQHLVRTGVLKGVRGPRGGYTLARERRRITVGEVIRAVDELERAEEDQEEPTSEIGLRVARPLWLEAQNAALARLDTVTMEDLCQSATELGVARAGEPVADFTI